MELMWLQMRLRDLSVLLLPTRAQEMSSALRSGRTAVTRSRAAGGRSLRRRTTSATGGPCLWCCGTILHVFKQILYYSLRLQQYTINLNYQTVHISFLFCACYFRIVVSFKKGSFPCHPPPIRALSNQDSLIIGCLTFSKNMVERSFIATHLCRGLSLSLLLQVFACTYT